MPYECPFRWPYSAILYSSTIFLLPFYLLNETREKMEWGHIGCIRSEKNMKEIPCHSQELLKYWSMNIFRKTTKSLCFQKKYIICVHTPGIVKRPEKSWFYDDLCSKIHVFRYSSGLPTLMITHSCSCCFYWINQGVDT